MWIRYGEDEVREVSFEQLGQRHFEGSVPWRAMRSRRGQAHLPGSYWSSTMGGQVVFESQLELARLLLADFDPDVVGIRAQPCWMRHRVKGRVRRHVPDFLLTLRSGLVRVVNVKPADRAKDPKVREALAWPGELFTAHGWLYEVWSGGEPMVLKNVRFLAGYRRPWVVDGDLVERACELVREGDELALAERRLCSFGECEDVRPALLSLLWRGYWTTDLTRPLSGRSVLRRCT
ncbi:TnsA-like heteromeric transposase endonuclease subunit [Streptomyces sp. ISL-94]|uniref:TnsA-like heteromeric transposase endonuclease subunit n=1 Tax=Streptomyces sp. ISL-94 TaxID=2819190 RepID=UPI0027E47285|nr:TnsA-like heteromeric transposase endonuclease subunit [Streptomyces sp. ISL-94]